MNMIIDEANREKHDNIDFTIIAAFTSESFVIISTFVGSQLDDFQPIEIFLFPMSFRIGEIGDKSSSNEEAMLICIHLKVAYQMVLHGTRKGNEEGGKACP